MLVGTPANPTILDTATATPFSALSFTDAESNGGTITITFTAANGALSGTGLTGSAGNYTLSGANPAELTARLQALVFTPAQNQVAPGSNVVTTFTLTPNDGSANGSAVTAQVTATSVNDAPVLGGLPGTPVGVFDNATVSPFANATIADPDPGQTIVVSVALDDAAKGTLAGGGFVHQGGGVYTFSAASAAAAQTALRALVFTPAANRVAGGATETTTFSVTVSDGTAQASGSAQVLATGVNDAPTLTPGSVVAMIGTDENDTWPTGTLVSALLAGAGYADADPGAFAGIAVTAQTIVGSGTWFYSPNGGATWINIASVSSTSSLLLASTAQLRFVPDGVVGGTATLTFRAWDGTTGTASDTISRFADTTTNGGTTAFSAAVATATKAIVDINDPPTLAATGTNPTFTEGGTAATLFSGVTISTIEPGETIVALTLTVSGLADGAAERLLIGGQALALTHGTTLALTGGGTASVSVAGGVATVSITGLSRTPAEAQTLVQSLAYENTSDDPTVAGGRTVTLISIRDSGGTANGGQDTTSVTIASAVTLEAVNDAPSLGQTSFALPPTDENTTAATTVFDITSGLGFADPDGPGRGIAVIGSTGLGTWQFSTDGGVAWSAIGFVAAGNALLLSDAVQIRYVPNGVQGETATLTVRGWDRSSGVVGDRVDATTVGTATTFSTQVGTATLVVAAINDPPVLTGTVGGTFTETVANAGAAASGASVFLVSSDATVTDPDQPAAFPGATLTVSFASYQTGDRISFAATFGPYTYDSGTGEIRVGGTAVASVAGGVGGALVVTFTGAATNAVVTDVLRNVVYFHVGDDPTAGGTATTRAVSVVFNDGGNTGAGGPLSSDALTGDLTIVALNDPEGFAGTIAPTFAEGALPVPLAPGATVTRVDAASFDGGSLTVALGTYSAGDVLSILESGGITVSGGVVSFGGARIGTVSGGAGADLVVSFDRPEATHAAVQALARAIVFDNASGNPADFGAAPTRAVTMTLDDGGNSGVAGSTTSTLTGTIAIVAVDTPPSVTPSADMTFFDPNGGSIRIDPGLVVADPDSLTLVRAIVTLPVSPDNNFESIGFTTAGLTALFGNGMTANYNSGTRSLTINGAASVEVYQTILRNVTYSNLSGTPDATPREIAFTVRDATGLDSVVVTRTVVIANTIAPTFQEGDPPLLLSPATLLSATGLTFDGGSVTAALGAYAPGDVLSIREIGGITVVGGVVFFEGARIGTVSGGVGAALVVSLDRPEATRDAVQALGRAIAFQNTTANPTDFGNAPNRAVTLTIVGSDPSQDRTIAGTLAIVAVNDAPVVTPSAGDAVFTIGGGRIVIDPGIVVADVDSTNLNRAVVVLSASTDSNLEVLGFTNAGLDALIAAGLSANYSSGTRALTITGSASVEVYQTLLRNITFANSATTPDTTPRTLTFTVRDAAGLESTVAERSIVLVANALPVVTIGTLPSVAEGGSVILTPAIVTATDVETTDPAQLVFTITALSNGIVRLDGTALAVGGTFTQADVNAGRVTYLHDASETTTGGFSFTVRDADNGTSGAQTLAFAITPVNDAPTISVAGVLTAPEDVPTALVGISFADPDAGSSPVFVTLSVARGTLIATSGSGVTVAGSGTGAITLLGSVADINAFVAASGVTFLTAQDDDQNVALTITIDDLGNTGSGGAQSATATVTIFVDPVNDVPVVDGLPVLRPTTDKIPIAPFATVTVVDPDVGQPLTVTVTIGQPGQGGFTAASLAASGFAATGVPGVFALVAPDAAAAQAALRALVFQPVENRILPGTTETTTFTVSVSDGVAPAVERVASVVVTSINDAPVVGGLPPGQSVAHDGTLQPFAGMLVADPDAGQTLSVRIAIGNPGTGGLTAASLAAAGFVEIAPGLYERNGFANPDAAAAALRGLVFQPVANAVPPGASASVAITVTVSDGTAAATSTGTVTIVGPQLQAPIPPPPPPVVPPAPPPAPPPVAPPPIIFVPGPPIGGPAQIPTFGGAVVSILAPDRGGPVAAPGFSPISATSGFFLAPSDGSGLGIAIRASTPVGDFVMRSGGGSASFTLPPATFVVESAGAQVLVGALLADGSPLPAWVQFDPATGTFRVDVPPGFTGTLDIVLTARLATGESASTGFRIAVDAESEPAAPQDAPAQEAPTQEAPPQEAPPQRQGAAPAPEPVRLIAEGGKPAFSDAVKAASRGAWATQGQSFLDDLIATLPGGRPSGEIEGDSRNGRDAA
ncbi:cadherin-like domain-containing protein [Salinarimonas sp.]|uniref:cadherin-like domain-containing protein n=1 Tax=Salinarimonas sp. TaxID=2766526 RepID=UPI00391CF57F